MATTIDEVMNTSEIQWIMSKVKVEKPYADEGIDYTEWTFSGDLPKRMADKIKGMMKGHNITEQEGNFYRYLTIKFGTKRSNNNRITFFYGEETE